MIRCRVAELLVDRDDAVREAVDIVNDDERQEAADAALTGIEADILDTVAISPQGRRGQAELALSSLLEAHLDDVPPSPALRVVRGRLGLTEHPDTGLMTILAKAVAAQATGRIEDRDALLVEARDVRALTIEGMAVRLGVMDLLIAYMTRPLETATMDALAALAKVLQKAEGLRHLVCDVLPALDRFQWSLHPPAGAEPLEEDRPAVEHVWCNASSIGRDIQWLLGLHPETWVEMAVEAGHQPKALVEADGRRGLYTGQVDLAFRVPPVAEEHGRAVVDTLIALGHVVDIREVRP